MALDGKGGKMALGDTGAADGVVMTPAQIVAALGDSIHITADMKPQDNIPDPYYDSLGDGPTPDDIALSSGTEASGDQVVYDEAMADDVVPEIANDYGVTPADDAIVSDDSELDFMHLDDGYFA